MKRVAATIRRPFAYGLFDARLRAPDVASRFAHNCRAVMPSRGGIRRMAKLQASMSLIALLLISEAIPITASAFGVLQTPSVPILVRTSGYLATVGGEPRTGTVTLVVSLYEQQSGGTPLWLEEQVVTLDST